MFRTLAWVRALRHKGVRIAEPPAELFDVEMNADCTIFPEDKSQMLLWKEKTNDHEGSSTDLPQ